MIRSPALLLTLLCLAGAAHAAPATDAQIHKVMKTLGMAPLGLDMARLLIDNTPALERLPESDRQCAQATMRELNDAHFRTLISTGLGDDGDQVVTEWLRFLATPAGRNLASVFAGASSSTLGEKALAGMSGKDRVEMEAFMASRTYSRFIAAFDPEADLPDDLGAQIAKGLKDQCRISLTPDDIS